MFAKEEKYPDWWEISMEIIAPHKVAMMFRRRENQPLS